MANLMLETKQQQETRLKSRLQEMLNEFKGLIMGKNNEDSQSDGSKNEEQRELNGESGDDSNPWAVVLNLNFPDLKEKGWKGSY